jgi:hypothetical protein
VQGAPALTFGARWLQLATGTCRLHHVRAV